MREQPVRYRFGPFEVRCRTRELYKHGIKLKLRPQPFHVLKALVERAGDVVTRAELRELLWAKETFVDFEHGLNTSIRELRGVLNDAANDPRYIETLPKLGYRMIMPVEVEEAGAQANESAGPSLAAAARVAEADGAVGAGVVRASGSRAGVLRRWAVPVAIVLLLVTGLAVDLRWSHNWGRPQAMNGRQMLAVLPFENLTGDAGQEYFSDGLTEEMIGQVGRLDPAHLGVIARTSVMHYKGNHEQLEEIGRELHVQYVLEGSVRRDGERVRVSAQLIQTKDQTHVWSRKYDRELSNLLTLQDEIAREIAGEIQVTLGESKHVAAVRESPLSPSAIEAHDLYLKGLYFWNKRTTEGFPRAIDYFQQAINKDPNDARAYAGLADCYALIGGYSGIQKTEYAEKARAAARKALDLDDSLPEAHTAWALVIQNYDWDWENAEKEYRRAIELNPNYATAHHWYAEHLSWRGRFDEALEESERARQLDPLSLIIAADNGAILYRARQYDRAIEQLRYVQELDPNFPRAGIIKASYVQKGMYGEALGSLPKGTPNGDAPWYWAERGYTCGRAGRQVQAKQALETLLEENRRRQVDASYLVLAYLGVGNNEQALTWLEWAAVHQPNGLTGLKVDPVYDPLRGDPRFQELVRRVRLDR
jgi:TolB-like protein/DNA-binding winged helix-turn-helix (wHTH) protein/Flp pilus assembly protein TadD